LRDIKLIIKEGKQQKGKANHDNINDGGAATPSTCGKEL